MEQGLEALEQENRRLKEKKSRTKGWYQESSNFNQKFKKLNIFLL